MSLSGICVVAVLLVFAEESDLWRRNYICVCRGSVSVTDLCRRSYIGVCRGGVCVSDLRRCSYIGVSRSGVSVSDLCLRVSYK